MDLYGLLGLTRTASSSEIERAYRRLARRYHPGVNPGDRVAEQAYRQIQEAYRVLTDAERRREYDRGGVSTPLMTEVVDAVAFDGFDFSTTADGPLAATFSELFSGVFRRAAEDALAPERGADIELGLRISFADAVRGVDAPVSVTRQAVCGGCRGHGQVGRTPIVCPSCQGQRQLRWARGHMVFTKSCETCVGTGQLSWQPCRQCRGAGVTARTEVVTVHVPAGTETGMRLALPGKGHAAGGGSATGDLYIQVEVEAHPYFRRQGLDLHVSVPVGVHEAALGALIDVPGLEGEVPVRIPAGAASGMTIRLPGHGLSSARLEGVTGDLVVEVQIVVPASLDERSAVLLREFGRLNDLAPVRRALLESPQWAGGRSTSGSMSE
jgi:molecular chaperone DnaJ